MLRFFINCNRRYYAQMKSLGLIVIGNEVLNGQVKDENMNFIINSLPPLGIKLHKVSIIPDDLIAISKEVNAFSQKYSFVITSGGIGPTHDDLTFEGVSMAFGESLYQHPVLTKKLMNFFNIVECDSNKEPRLKLAKLPESAVLTFGEEVETGNKIMYPVISVRNVFMLPGIPSLFKKGFNIIKRQLVQSDLTIFTKVVYIKKEESLIVKELNKVINQCSDSVLFGSYPVLNNNYFKVKITMESLDNELLIRATNILVDTIGQDNVSNYNPMVFSNASENVYQLSNSTTSLGKIVKSTLETIEEVFRRYKNEEIVIAFTGGKDCTVLMHLVYAYIKQNYEEKMIRSLFMRTRPSFPEVEEFINHSLTNYGIVPPRSNFLEYNGPIKESLFKMKIDYPEIKAVLMGTKKSDPNGKQSKFSQTTSGWPDYCLINPLLDWNYSDIWNFLLQLSIPYCSLYDKGYTSLGGIDNTLPNSRLMYTDKSGQKKFHPAYLLQQDEAERNGRSLSDNNTSDN